MRTDSRISKQKEKGLGFSKLSEPQDVLRFLTRAVADGAPADVQLSGSGLRFTSRVHPDTDLNVGVRICKPKEMPEAGSGSQSRFKTQSANVVLFLRTPELICITTTGARWDKGDLLLPQPWTAFRLQRRKEPRYEIPGEYEFVIKFRSPGEASTVVTKRVLDVSTSGIGILIENEAESLRFTKGLFLRKTEMILENKHIFMNLRVARVNPIKDRPRALGYKVGVEITRVSPVDAMYLNAYVARGLVKNAKNL